MTEFTPQFHLMPDRAVVSIEGDEAQAFLQGLITQDVDKATEQDAIFSALLTPQGKILFEFLLVKTAKGFLTDVAREAAEGFAKRLKLYKLRAKVDIVHCEDLAVGWSANAIDSLTGHNTAHDKDQQTAIAFTDPRLDKLGTRVIADRGLLTDGPEPTTHEPTTPESITYEDLRLEAGVPEFLKDFTADSIFQMDVNHDALNGIDYKKGCFVGQEVASRMKRKSAVRKRTYCVSFDGNPPAIGASIVAGEKTIGEISSVGTSTALARIRTDRLDTAEGPLTADGINITLTAPDYLED